MGTGGVDITRVCWKGTAGGVVAGEMQTYWKLDNPIFLNYNSWVDLVWLGNQDLTFKWSPYAATPSIAEASLSITMSVMTTDVDISAYTWADIGTSPETALHFGYPWFYHYQGQDTKAYWANTDPIVVAAATNRMRQVLYNIGNGTYVYGFRLKVTDGATYVQEGVQEMLADVTQLAIHSWGGQQL